MLNPNQLLQILDRIKPDMKPLAPHFAATQDTHTRVLYATLLAAMLLSNGQVTDAESRLFGMLLQSLQLENQVAKFYDLAQRLTGEQLKDFFRSLNTSDLKSAFVLDAMILARIDSPLNDAQSQLVAEILDVFGIQPEQLNQIVGLASMVLGLSIDYTKLADAVTAKIPKDYRSDLYEIKVDVVLIKEKSLVVEKDKVLGFKVMNKSSSGRTRPRGFLSAVALSRNEPVNRYKPALVINNGLLIGISVKVDDVVQHGQTVAYVLPIPQFTAAWRESFGNT